MSCMCWSIVRNRSSKEISRLSMEWNWSVIQVSIDCSRSIIWVSILKTASLEGLTWEEEATERAERARSSYSRNQWNWAFDFITVAFPKGPSGIFTGSFAGMFVNFFLRIFMTSPPKGKAMWLSSYISIIVMIMCLHMQKGTRLIIAKIKHVMFSETSLWWEMG
jgi:hypothetical protein